MFTYKGKEKIQKAKYKMNFVMVKGTQKNLEPLAGTGGASCDNESRTLSSEIVLDFIIRRLGEEDEDKIGEFNCDSDMLGIVA